MSAHDPDPNQRIARLMGWQRNEQFDWVTDKLNEAWTRGETLLPSEKLPDYFSPDLPIGERLKMWEKLTEEQKVEFVSLFWRAQSSPSIFDVEICVKLLGLDQPTFASTFLRVVEGKG
jgi:hypothetical protein